MPVNSGLDTTFSILSRTPNEAATGILLSALHTADFEIQLRTIRALLQRRSVAGQREILRRWHTLDDRWKKYIADAMGHLAGPMREALLGADEQLFRNCCDAMLWLREYDLLPTLTGVAEDRAHAHSDLAAKTLLALADALYGDWRTPHDKSPRRDLEQVALRTIHALEGAVERFERHECRELLEAFLILATNSNPELERILKHSQTLVHETITNLLSVSTRPGIIQLALSFLDNPYASAAVYSVLASRRDIPFVRHLVKRFAHVPPATARGNVKRITAFSWLQEDFSMLLAFSEEEQSGCVRLVMASGMGRERVLEIVRFLLHQGHLGARRVAAEELATWNGPEVNELIVHALSDEDSRVQSYAVRLLRERRIPGAVNSLLDALHSPHAVVVQAAREALSEFTFERYLNTFDLLEPEARHNAGLLVKRVNPELLAELRPEFSSGVRTRRLRAVHIAEALELVSRLEPELMGLLSDDDHFLRSEAARVLSGSTSEVVRAALREVLLDDCYAVRDTAEQSLQCMAERGNRFNSGAPAFPLFDLDEPDRISLSTQETQK